MEFITFGPVHLNVTNLENSVRFYHDVLGMLVRKSGNPTEVGTTERTLVVLHPDAKFPYRKGHSGLYHFAIHMPTERELAQLFVRVAKKGWRSGPTDHIIAKSVYVNDPDGIDIELSVELPGRVVEYIFTDDEFKVVDDKGKIRSPVEPLDIQELLAHLNGDTSEYLFPDKAFVGHINLHMPNLQNAYEFYKKIGFTEHFIFPNMGWGDLGAGGLVDHRIAVNTWAGINAPKTPAGIAGLKHFILKYDSQERLSKALSNISNTKEQNKEHTVEDPAGNQIILTT